MACRYQLRDAARGGDQKHLFFHEILRQCLQFVIVTFCPAVEDPNVAAFDVALITQAVAERGYEAIGSSRRNTASMSWST